MVQIVILGKFSIPTECTPTMKTSRMLQGVSQGAYLGIVPHTHRICLQGKDTDNFSNNRSDAGINLSFEVKIILNGSGKCFADSVFNISRVSEWEEKDAIAFSEQMIFGYDIFTK